MILNHATPPAYPAPKLTGAQFPISPDDVPQMHCDEALPPEGLT